MIVGVHQPNYIPWLGYFRKLALCDVFVFFDHVQMPGGKSFVSRNAIKTAQGRAWLTVPVSGKGPGTRIIDAAVVGDGWARKHLRTLKLAYSRAPAVAIVEEMVEPILNEGHAQVADLNIALIQMMAQLFGFGSMKFVRASKMDLQSNGAESIHEILELTGAKRYLTGSGEGSLRHLDTERLGKNGIETEIFDWVSSTYRQQHGAFETNLSAIYAILNCGPDEAAALIARP